jgi:hypothetical protein
LTDSGKQKAPQPRGFLRGKKGGLSKLAQTGASGIDNNFKRAMVFTKSIIGIKNGKVRIITKKRPV